MDMINGVAFCELSEDLMCAILFSGYLGFGWTDLFYYTLINRYIYALGKRSIGLLRDGMYPVDTLRAVAQLSNLVHIDLCRDEYIDQSDAILYVLQQNSSSSLRVLDLKYFPVPELSLRKISQFTKLQYLALNSWVSTSSLESTPLCNDDSSWGHLQHLVCLEYLDLSGTSIPSQALAQICSLRDINGVMRTIPLTHLFLHSCHQLDDRIGEYLCHLPLKALDIGGCPRITAELLHPLLASK